jgi:poly-beta-1,6-N-acetyl-D-glucosamine biosynthesis protein PgaD
MKSPIIEQPALQSRPQRLIYALVTAFAWFGWGYLTWPFLGIVATASGIPVVSQQEAFQYSATLIADLQRIMWWCVVTAALCAILFPSWAGYHIARFGTANKRQVNKRSGPEKLASDFRVPLDALALVQGAKRMLLEHDQISLRVMSVEAPSGANDRAAA